MNSNALCRDVLLISLAGYFAQGPLYSQGSVLSRSFLIIIFGISSFYFFKTLFLRKSVNLFFRAWSALLILNVFGFIFTGDLSSPRHINFLKEILLGLMVFYPFYYFKIKGDLHSKTLIFFFILMLPLTVMQFYLNAELIIFNRRSANDNLVNNVAYSFVWLIPFVYLFKGKKFLSISVIALLIFFIIQGAKRGAVIAGAIALTLFIYYIWKSHPGKSRRLRSYFLAVFGIFFLAYYFYDVFVSNEYLLSRMSRINEGGSGRNLIFSDILNGWYSSNSYFHLIFGFGFAASWDLAGNYAHNDWLELLSNFGLIGVFIYGILIYSVVIEVRRKNMEFSVKMLLWSVLLLWLFVSMVSMGYMNASTSFLMAILLAYSIGEKNNLTIKNI